MRNNHDATQDPRPNNATLGGTKGTDAREAEGGGIAHRGDGGVVLLLSVTEAARALRLGRSKTYELIASGDLEVVHVGRCSRVPVDAIEAFVERLRSSVTGVDTGSRP